MRLSLGSALMGMAAASLLVAVTVMVPGSAAADEDRCVPVTDAVNAWGSQFPVPANFVDGKICHNACNQWYSGCRDTAYQAARCERNAAGSQASLNKTICRNHLDKEIKKACDKFVNEGRAADTDAANTARSDAYAGCKLGLDLCRAGCESSFSGG